MKKIVALVLAMVMVLGLATTAFAVEAPELEAAKTYSGLYAEATDKDAATYTDVAVAYFDAVAPAYDKKGDLEEYGVVAFYAVEDADSDLGIYIKVNTVADADLVIYKDAAMKKDFLKLKAIASPYYLGTGKAYDDFGTACGQSAYDYDKTLDYYTWDDCYFEEATFAAFDEQLMVGGKLVPVNDITDEIALNEHVPSYTWEDGEIVAVECSVCDEPAKYAANFKSVPVGAQSVDGSDNDYWYWTAKAAAPAEDTTVESPKTFDAGIAMYVGMSVMAAAGSAVVLKKKD